MDAAKLLNLEPERVASMAQAYEGLANTAPPNASERPVWRRANDFALAGCYWAALDADRASGLLTRAASLYFKLALSGEGVSGTPTAQRMVCASKAVTLATSAGDTPQVREHAGSWLKETDDAPAEEVLAKLLTASFLTLERRDDNYERIYYGLTEIAGAMPAHPAGRLGWPLRAYSEVVGAIVEFRRDGIEPARFHNIFGPFAQRLSDTIRSAQKSAYHWRRLYSRLLPIEPEALIICEAAEVLLEKRELPDRDRRRAFSDFPSATRAYFEVATEIRARVNRDSGQDFNAPSFS